MTRETTPRIAPKARLVTSLLLAVGTATTALADPAGVQVVAMSGTPTANGVMSSFFHHPSIGDGGHIAFHAYLEGTLLGVRDAYAAFRASPGNPSSIVEISRRGNALPDANGMMDAPYFSSVNASGSMCGLSYFTGTNAGEDDDSGLMMSTGGAPIQIARQGAPFPDSDGTYDQFDGVHINDAGQVTFRANAHDGQSFYESGIFRFFGGTITTLIRTGDPAPGGIGQIDFVWPDVDSKSNGTLAFWASLDSAGDSMHDERVYRHMNGVTTTIAREGDVSPDANGQLWQNNGNFIAIARASENGNVAFRADLLGTSGGESDNAAIFRGTGGPLTMIARKGQPAPDGNGHFTQLYLPDVANSGRVIFEAVLDGTTGGNADNQAFYSGSGGALTTIFREGQPTPSGDGQFTCDFLNWNCNASGEIAIRTNLRNTQSGGNNDSAVYFYRPGAPLLEIARTGTPMLGSTVKSVNITDQSYAPAISPINASGQIAFHFELEDGRNGIARFTPPPTCLGDFNNDGVRNTLDLTMFLGKFAQVVTPWGVGDMNGDGVVNTLDLTAFLGVFGVPCR